MVCLDNISMSSSWRTRKFEKVINHNSDITCRYIEEFLLTLAWNHTMSGVFISPGQWEYDNPIHCCNQTAIRYYEEWFMSGECRAHAMLHPMKNKRVDLWGPPVTTHDRRDL